MSDKLTKTIVFNMHNQYFAFEISDITDVSRLRDITRVPNTPPFVKGVINLRGKVVLLISLSVLLGFEDTKINKNTRIIIFRINGEKIGFIVENIEQIIKVDLSMLQSVDDVETAKYIKGSLLIKDTIITLLDETKLIASKKI